MKKVSKVLLVNKDKILLHLRDNKKEIIYPNMWSLFGGTIDKNESPEDAAMREVKEEISFNLINPKLIEEIVYKENGEKVKIFVFSGIIDKEIGELVLTEGQKMKYFTYEELLEIDIPNIFRELILDISKSIQK